MHFVNYVQDFFWGGGGSQTNVHGDFGGDGSQRSS